MELAELVARQEIADVLHRYCRAVDRRDPDLLRSTYHEDAEDDHGVYRGPVDGLVDFMQNDGLAVVHHAISNISIELDGDVAHTECYLDAVHRREDDTGRWDEMVKGRYLDRFERRDGEWRIAHRLVVYDWGRIERATEAWWDTLPGDWTMGARDRTDPIHTHGVGSQG
jgi:3-phenylpropionate/cinnamic acid dioxygenase small subunit